MENFHLPTGYRQNAQASHEVDDAPGFWSPAELEEPWQVPVYRLAAELAQTHKRRKVLDIGCGTGVKLTRIVGPVVRELVGVDQASGIALARATCGDAAQWVEADFANQKTWDDLALLGADFIICADVIEHVDDPAGLLRGLSRLASNGALLLISTPDRDLMEDQPRLGPPRNPRHMREWTHTEFQALLRDCGFATVRSWHLFPQSYRMSPRLLVRAAYRVSKLRHPLDRRSNMAFLATTDE